MSLFRVRIRHLAPGQIEQGCKQSRLSLEKWLLGQLELWAPRRRDRSSETLRRCRAEKVVRRYLKSNSGRDRHIGRWDFEVSRNDLYADHIDGPEHVVKSELERRVCRQVSENEI